MNLARYFMLAVKRFPGAVALVDEQGRWSYQELYKECERVAGGLGGMGLRAGDHVLVVLKNRRENVVIYWACQMLGLIYTPLNFRMSAGEIGYCVGDALARVVFYEEGNRATIEEALKLAGSEIQAIEVGAGQGSSSFVEMCRSGSAASLMEGSSDDDIALMLYTSGTTGKPKGVPRSHKNEVSAAQAHIMQNNYVLFESTVGVMPLYHTMGMRVLLATMFLNGKLVLLPDYDARAVLELIAGERVSSLYLVPTLYHDLVQLPELSRYDLSALVRIGYAGAAMTSALTHRCFERLQPKTFVNHFGSSEVYTFTICSWLDRKPTCAGRPGLQQEVRIVTADPGRLVLPEEEVGIGMPGEVIVSLASPEAFGGYWRRPDADRKAIRDGWYFTGDVGQWDDEGDLWVQGRVDDMLISGGENIHPLEVEDVLARHPGVLEVAVVGVPDERWGQIVVAFVVARESALTAEELDRFCLASSDLARFKRPRRYVFVKGIPKSAVGKILRRKLQAGEYEPVYKEVVKREGSE